MHINEIAGEVHAGEPACRVVVFEWPSGDGAP